MHEKWMQQCVAAAQKAAQAGNYPIAAAIVMNDELISLVSSELAYGNDPTAHPEITVIRTAAAKIGSRYLTGATLYTTLEPCPMCTAAAIWAKCDGIVFGARQSDALAWAAQNPHAKHSWRQIEVNAATIIAAGTPQLLLTTDVLRDDCKKLFDR